MRGCLLNGTTKLVLLLALGVQKGSNAAAVPNPDGGETGSTPLLLGPPDEDVTAPVTASITSMAMPTSSMSSSATSTSQSSTTDNTSLSTTAITFSASSSITSASTTASAAPPSPPANAEAGQPSSVRFLIPVFLLVIITIAGWLYSRYRNRRRHRHDFGPSGSSITDEGTGGGWKEIRADDTDDEMDDLWHTGDDADAKWTNVDLHGVQPTESANGKGWGWKSTFHAWRSARGKAEAGEEGGMVDEMGQKHTIKLVAKCKPSETYQTMPSFDVSEATRTQDRPSNRALRDKLATLTYRASPPARSGLLTRDKSPNKRRAREAAAPPVEPAWIRSRAVSPTSQMLSPPMHPHLFFHPSTNNREMSMAESSRASESGSDYGSDEESHMRFPTIPITAETLASSYTALSPRTPRTPKTPTEDEIVETDKDQAQGRMKEQGVKTQSLRRPPKRTSLSGKGLKRNSTTPASRAKNPPSTQTTPSAKRTAEARTPTTLHRSTAVKDLASPSNDTTPRPSSLIRLKSVKPGSTSSDPTVSSPRKSRVQRKQERAQGKVEDILKASWSDRALSSPVASPGIDRLVATSSPGVEEAAVLSGGGIEHRLAMLRSLKV